MACPEKDRRVGSSRNGDSPILRKLHDLATIRLRKPVDLFELCNSYQSAGAMGLPRDVVEQILCFLQGDIRTLKVVSLTCRVLFSATRRLIHRRVRLATRKVNAPWGLADRIAVKVLPARRVHEAHMQYLSVAGKRGLLGYTRELIVTIGPSFSPETFQVYLDQFRSFEQIRILRIHQFDLPSFLPLFERCFTQFVSTLRSLHLPDVVGGVHELLEFICKFPHLDDLSLTLSSAHSTEVPPRLYMEHSPSLRGKLILRGGESTSSRFLLEIPGGIHFHSIDAGGIDKAELNEILVACSSTLRVFSFCPRSIRDGVDLSQNLVLERFELRSDPDDLPFIPYLLQRPLSTIASPVFSEFTLKLEGLPVPNRTPRTIANRTVWGDWWGTIDSLMDDMALETGRDIRIVVLVATPDSVWSPDVVGFVGDVFPLVNMRGLLKVVSPEQVDDGSERFIW